MSLINCPECGKQISDRATSCPYCGCPSSYFWRNNKHVSDDNSHQHKNYYTNDSAFSQNTNASGNISSTNKNITLPFTIVIIVFIVLVVIIKFIKSDSYTVSKEVNISEENTFAHSNNAYDELISQTSESSMPEEETVSIEDKIDYDSLSEEDYKMLCSEMWYDDIFFSKESLKGKLVKLDLFVEENRLFDAETVLSNSMVSDFLEQYDIKRTFYFCGVNRKDEVAAYTGGHVNLYIPNDFDISMSLGDHLMFYGEIIEYSTTTLDGYNSCYIIPKYIENKGQ